jgi:competence protein ComK
MLNSYEINDDTYAIISTNQYKTKVIEKEYEYDINENAYKVMDDSCKYYGSSYKGRLEAAKKILDCSYKLPILVEESSALIFFPIKSSLLEDCCWININSITNIEKVDNKSLITFKNGKKMMFDVSKLSIENQIYRSSKLEATILKRINRKKRD